MRHIIIISITVLVTFITACKKDKDPVKTPDITCIDADGHSYKTIQIGDQVWMAENLRTTKFNDGTPIEKSNHSSYPTYQSPFCDSFQLTLYGQLYNAHVMLSDKIAPQGWRVPDNEDWLKLITYLGGSAVAGGKMKANFDWKDPNVGASNSSGFNAYGTGYYNSIGYEFGQRRTLFWSKTNQPVPYALELCNEWDYCDLDDVTYPNSRWYSIRCIKN